MNDEPTDLASEADPILNRLERMEHEHENFKKSADRRLVLSETRFEALRAGMVDLDSLKSLDLSDLTPSEDGTVPGVTNRIAALKKEQPWLFARHSSSSTATPPTSGSLRPKHATEMDPDEYRIARARMIARHQV